MKQKLGLLGWSTSQMQEVAQYVLLNLEWSSEKMALNSSVPNNHHIFPGLKIN
jgi:hypothetical protein